MIRRFNYTNRSRIAHSYCMITLYDKTPQPSVFDLKINPIAFEGIQPDSNIILEAYRGPLIMRFECGKINEFQPRSNMHLNNFDPSEPVLFRLKILDSSDPHKLIRAWADGIRPVSIDRQGNPHKGILPVKSMNLGDEIWQLNWDEPTRPVLCVNMKVSDAKEMTSIVKYDSDFACLVFPDMLRTILEQFLLYNDCDIDTLDDNEWIIFGKKISGEELPKLEEDTDDERQNRSNWIENVVTLFSQKMSITQRYCDFKRG